MEIDFRRSVVTLLVLVAFSVAAFGQAETGQLSGTISDSTGALVVGAKVELAMEGTEAKRTTTTSQTGRYTFTGLLPGVYKMTVEASGFASAKRRTQITVGGKASVDVTMEVGQATETVEVIGEQGVQVQTQTQTLSNVISGSQVTELISLTRNPYDFVRISGNISENDPTGRGAGVAINGQRASSTSILLDGGDNVDLFRATPGQNVPLDSVQEFRVSTSSFTADLGRAGGGVINVATKSGTNSFHGSAYEFYRGSSLTSNTAENNARGNPKGQFVRNAFGYSIGGPIIKDKLFFFQNTEWTRVRSSAVLSRIVPMAGLIGASNANTQAFFTAFGTLDPNATLGTIHTVADIVADNAIGGGSFSALPGATQAFQDITYTVPSNAGGGDPRNAYSLIGRVDYTVSDKTNLYGRYALENQLFFEGSVSNSAYDGYSTGAFTRNQNMALTVTHTWSPTIVTTSKVQYNRLNDATPLGANPDGPTLYMRGSLTRLNGLAVNFPGYLPFNPGSAIPFGGPQNLYQIHQDVTWQKGNHTINAGGSFIHTKDNRSFGAYQNSVQTLSSTVTGALNNFVDGNLLSFTTAFDPQGKFPCPRPASNNFLPVSTPACQLITPASQPRFGRNNLYNDTALYIQDSWKIRPGFTLNFGLRWEYYGVQHNADRRLDSNYYLGSGSNYFERLRNGFLQIAEDSSIGDLWARDFDNFAPRVGFAWDIFGDGKTSLRGGYGLGYERNFGNVTFNVIQNPPNYGVVVLQAPAFVPTITTNNLGPLGTPGVTDIPRTSTRNPVPNINTAYSAFWSLAFERQLMKDAVFSVEYSASKGTHLYTLENPNKQGTGPIWLGDDPALFLFNRIQPQYASLNTRGDAGFSNYNALVVSFRSTNLFNKGLNMTANYTWSHTIDNLSSTFSEAANNFHLGLLDPFNPGLDKGNSDFDTRHRFTFSGTWDVPWHKNSSNWFLKNVVGGWQLSPILNMQVGSPFTVWDCTNAVEVCIRYIPSGSVDFGAQGQGAPTGDPNRFVYNVLPPAIEYFNGLNGLSDFGDCTIPGQGATQICPYPAGMTRRNSFRSPGYWNLDLGIFKNIQVTERVKVQFRTELFNAFNHKNLYIQGSTAGDNLDFASSFTTTAGRGGFGSTVDERRNIQLGLKVIF